MHVEAIAPENGVVRYLAGLHTIVQVRSLEPQGLLIPVDGLLYICHRKHRDRPQELSVSYDSLLGELPWSVSGCILGQHSDLGVCRACYMVLRNSLRQALWQPAR